MGGGSLPLAAIALRAIRALPPRRGFALLALLASLSVANACQNQALLQPSQGKPNQSLDAYISQDTAETICELSQGALPNWGQVQKFKPYLEPSEAKAADELASDIRAQYAKVYWPKLQAISNFIAKHTTCSPLETETPEVQSDDPLQRALEELDRAEESEKNKRDDQQHFAYTQSAPIVPWLALALKNSDGLSQEEELAQWSKALEEAYDGETQDRKVIIVLTQKDERFILATSIARDFAGPAAIKLASDRFDAAILDDNLLAAEEAHADICLRDPKLCLEKKPLILAARDRHRLAVNYFNTHIQLERVNVKAVSYTHAKPYTLMTFEVQNTGTRDIQSLSIYPSGSQYGHCLIQAENQTNGVGLEIAAGAKTTAYCKVDGHFPPLDELLLKSLRFK